MNVSELQHRISAIRADEAAVSDALSGFQSALEAWLTAMAGVHDLLAAASSAAAGTPQRPLVVPGGLVTAESAPPPAPVEKSMFSSPVRPVMTRDEPRAGAEPGSDEEEQALLDSLDDETASAIRVRRRLSGGRKSVRDLLAEIQSEKKSPDQSQKKGWWT
jgi:hypothetical protein